jgi:PAS domain S-box-containing protein
MQSADSSQLAQGLHNRRHAIADHWYRAVMRTSFTPLKPDQVRQRLDDLTEQVIALLIAEHLDGSAARRIGAELADLRYVHPQALAGTQQALAQQIVEGSGADQIAMLYPRLVALLAELAAGFFAQSRETILTGQEQIRRAVVAEREQALESLRASEGRLSAIYNSASDLMFLLSVEPDNCCRYLSVNSAWLAFGSLSEHQVIGKSLEEIMPEPIRSHFTTKTKEAIETGKPVRFETDASLSKGLMHFDTTVTPIFDEAGNCTNLMVASHDITDRKRAELALRRYADEQSALYQISLEINSQSDVPTLLQAIIRRAAELIGVQSGALYLMEPDGQSLRLAVGYRMPQDRIGVTLHVGEGLAGRVAQSGNPLMVDDYRRWEGRASAFADSSFHRVMGVPLLARDKIIGVISVIDDQRAGSFEQDDIRLLNLVAAQAAIAIENAWLYEEAQKTASHLQTMSQRLVEAQETERRNVARELHDQIGQLITGLKLRLEMCARLPDDTLPDALGDAQTLVQELLERVRELSLDLRPTMLDDLGLVPALLWLFERFTAQTNVEVAFKHAGIELRRFAPKVETAAYRITQEALTNIARHAHASAVTVRLWATPEMLTVQIQDDGVGFDPEAVLADSISTGLSSMRERATLLGGHLEIESSPNAGARLTAELPLNELEVPEGLAIQGSQKQGQT